MGTPVEYSAWMPCLINYVRSRPPGAGMVRRDYGGRFEFSEQARVAMAKGEAPAGR
jgi:hypothetical protein